VRSNAQSMNRSQLYGVESGGSVNNQVRSMTKFRQEFISKRNGRSGQLSHGPEERGDPYQQRDVFGRHPKKLSKLSGNASNSEAQLRDQRNHLSVNLRRDLSS